MQNLQSPIPNSQAAVITVAIPTYNGERRLPELLDKLRRQINTEDFQWEILVVDNNSTDNTIQVIRDYQANWPGNYPLRYCRETKQGVGFARQRALSESTSTWVGFLDDDNIPTENWVASAYEFGRKHPKAGAYGSQSHPAYEVEPPENFDQIAPFLAITERGNKPLLYEPQKKILPPGAGLVVRRNAWLETVPNNLILQGRVGDSMLAGEDMEMLYYMQKAKWEIWYNPAMEIVHKIPAKRLQRDYLIPCFRGIGLSRHVTRMSSVPRWQQPIAFVAYMLNDLRKIILHLVKYRTAVKSDLVAACKMELFISSLVSPIYIWKLRYFTPSTRG